MSKEIKTSKKNVAYFMALVAVVTVVGVAAVTSIRNTAALREVALHEMADAAHLQDMPGVVYADDATINVGDGEAKPYAEIIRDGKIEAPKAFVVDSQAFGKAIAAAQKQKNDTWRKLMEDAMSVNVLRGVLAFEKSGDGYYFLMPTKLDNPMLVTLFDKKGEKRQFRASYKDMVPFRRELQKRWYMVMGLPAKPLDYSQLKKTEGLHVHYARTGQWLVSVAVIEVVDEVALKEDMPDAILIPLTEGWN